MKRFLFIIAAAVLSLSACSGGTTGSNAGSAGQTARNDYAQTEMDGGAGSSTGRVDKSDDNNDGKIDPNGDDGRTADGGLMGDMGSAVDDAANGVGNAAKDVVNGAEDMVDDVTGNPGRTTNNNN